VLDILDFIISTALETPCVLLAYRGAHVTDVTVLVSLVAFLTDNLVLLVVLLLILERLLNELVFEYAVWLTLRILHDSDVLGV
jgi:hypothetical protein